MLPEGSLTVLSGANGSGKSTVLRIIAGLSMATAGVVRGRARRVAVVPDRFVSPVRMTARSYLCHHGRVRGMTSAQAGRRAGELGERLGILPGLDVAVQDLSKGNAQKVALAQAFLAPVDLLVLDEPRTALDARAAAVLDELLAAASVAGTTVVLSDPTSGLAYPDASHYEIAGGNLVSFDGPAGPSDQQVTIRLRPRLPVGSSAPLTSFNALAVSIEPGGDDLTLVVGSDRSDDLLGLALREGWSVLDVRREAPVSPARRTAP